MDGRSLQLRRDILEMMLAPGRGHLASAFSLVEILRVLYDDVMRYDPARPAWPERDRFILSKGHGCLALYALLADKEFITPQAARGFCRFDGVLGGHPEYGRVPGVEATTGSLGHGLSMAIGMLLASRLDGREIRAFVVLGDGECNEGSVWEAAMAAAKHRLDNLVAIVDYNRQQSYDATSAVLELEPFADKWRAFGFSVCELDGHDLLALRATLSSLPLEPGKPSALICHTVKGKGVPFMERDLSWHHKSKLAEEDVARLRQALQPDDTKGGKS